jgi:hypothetical protein
MGRTAAIGGGKKHHFFLKFLDASFWDTPQKIGNLAFG